MYGSNTKSMPNIAYHLIVKKYFWGEMRLGRSSNIRTMPNIAYNMLVRKHFWGEMPWREYKYTEMCHVTATVRSHLYQDCVDRVDLKKENVLNFSGG